MKNLLLILMLIPFLFACESDNSETEISGTVDNLDAGFFILGGRGGAKDTIFLDENNSFKFELNGIEDLSAYHFSVGNDYVSMRISPGQEVEIYYDATDFLGTLKFSGDATDINNYLLDKSGNENIIPGDPDIYALKYEEYKAWADNNKVAKQELLANAYKEDESNPFWVTEEANILYGWASDLKMFPSYHKYYAKVEEVELPEDYESFKEALDINRPEYLESASYTIYVSSIVRESVNAVEGDDRALLTLKTAKELISNKQVLDHFSVNYLKGQVASKDLGELSDAIDYMKENVTDAELLAVFNKEYDDWKGLAAGQPGFNFVGKDLEGNEVKFSDFKGKYVYVDVWATWCGPCRYEIPFLKQLEADYHDKNIVFLSYSMDDDKQAWLDFVPEEELGGVQIIGENGWQSELLIHYKIRGVPTFMFFGPEGEIITVNMTRPSNQATRDKFDSYSDL